MRQLAVVLGLGLAGISYAQSPGPAIRYAVLESCIQWLRTEGILIGYPESPYRFRRPPSNYEYAVAANAALVRLDGVSRGWEGLLRKPSFQRPGSAEASEAVDWITSARQAFAALPTDVVITRLLFRAFPKELRDLGVDTVASHRILNTVDARWASFVNSPVPSVGSALQPFADIPANHWASAATTNLRREGILAGYPDGKFRGEPAGN